jgi:hypothetical protein
MTGPFSFGCAVVFGDEPNESNCTFQGIGPARNSAKSDLTRAKVARSGRPVDAGADTAARGRIPPTARRCLLAKSLGWSGQELVPFKAAKVDAGELHLDMPAFRLPAEYVASGVEHIDGASAVR